MTAWFNSPVLTHTKGVAHVFTSREGGCSKPPFNTLNLSYNIAAAHTQDNPEHVTHNRERVASYLGVPQAKTITVTQVHGHAVIHATHDTFPHTEADALYTFTPNLPIAVLVADCVPVLMANEKGTCAAAVHAGWRGTHQGICQETVRALHTHGIEPSSLRAALGPCIGPCCFKVQQDVAELLKQRYPNTHHAFTPHNTQYSVDLWALNTANLQEAGVLAHNIHTVKTCTACDSRFFSYRREQGQTGRQAGAIALVP